MYSRLFLRIITTVPSTSYFLPFKKIIYLIIIIKCTHFDKCIHLCVHHHNQVTEHIYHPNRFPHALLLLISTLQPQATSDVLFYVTPNYFTFSRISYKKNHTGCTLLCQPSLTQHNHIYFAICLYHSPIKNGISFSIS